MELDYIPDINAYGENIVRLYNFDQFEARKFRDILNYVVIENKQTLDLRALDFIESRNCYLILRIAEEDKGIRSMDNVLFICDLTIETYQAMLGLIEPFCNKDIKAYQWLYDVDVLTDFLFSPAGTW